MSGRINPPAHLAGQRQKGKNLNKGEEPWPVQGRTKGEDLVWTGILIQREIRLKGEIR